MNAEGKTDRPTAIERSNPPTHKVSRVLLAITALAAIVLAPLIIGTATPAAAVTANGWTATTLPLPAGSTQTYLNGISCTTATSCVAVGYDNNITPVSETLSGSTWAVTALPLPSG